MNSHVGSVDLRLRLALSKYGVVRHPLRHLNLNIFVREVRDVSLRVWSQTQNVGVIELHLGASAGSGRNFVAVDYGLIQQGRRPRARVSTLCRHIAMNHADSAYALIRLSR